VRNDMPRKKKVKAVTVSELQAFLTGAIEFNPDDWLPDVGQWNRIVEMIMNIKPDAPTVVVRNVSGELLSEDQVGDSPLDDSGPVELNSSLESDAPRIDMRQNNTETLHTNVDGKDENGVVSSGKKFRTPSRDDSEGMGPSEFS